MNPTPNVGALRSMVRGIVTGSTVSLRPVGADDAPYGDTTHGAVLDVEGLKVVVDGLGAMLRLEGRLYQATTGQAFDMVGLMWPPSEGRVFPGGFQLDEVHAAQADMPPRLGELIRLGRGDGHLRTRPLDVRDTPLQQHMVHDLEDPVHSPRGARVPRAVLDPASGDAHPTEGAR
jgi:hypothetical protein